MKRLLSLSLSLALVFTLAACTISDGEQTAAPDGSGGSAPSSDAQAPASSSEPESIAFDQEFSGGINAVMGTEEQNEVADMYEQEYKNIDLPEGVVLSISGVTVRLTCDDASGAPLTPRNQEITETVDLGNGNFVAGEDFPAGVYNIVAVSGGGNVSSSNLYDGGINAILGTEDQNELMDMYEQEYKNIDLPEGTTLTIDGVQVQLIPSP